MKARRSGNASMFLVCVDKAGQRSLSGRLYNGYFPEPFPFSDLGALLVLLDDLLDRLDFPQRHFAPRFLPGGAQQSTGVGEPGARWDIEMLRGRSGLCGTFRIHVLFRQNASLQGRLYWPGHRALLFRSALELLHMILAELQAHPVHPRKQGAAAAKKRPAASSRSGAAQPAESRNG